MTAEITPVNPYTLNVGDLVFFRNFGTGEPALCRVGPRGPLGQFRVTFIDDNGVDLPDGRIAVNEHRELWVKG
jgi:hypothetical protein